MPQKIQQIGDEVLNLDGFKLEFLAPGECEQPLG